MQKVLHLVLRVGALVLAVVILLVSAGTIGIIVNNEALDRVRTTSSSELSDAGLQLQVLILRSLGSAGWLILLAVGVGIAEIVAILLRVTFNTEAYKLALGVIEIVFSFGVAFCYFSTGIACAVYASAWGGPPDVCPDNDDDPCDSRPLTATNALQALFSFIQMGLFVAIATLIIFDIVKSRNKA